MFTRSFRTFDANGRSRTGLFLKLKLANGKKNSSFADIVVSPEPDLNLCTPVNLMQDADVPNLVRDKGRLKDIGCVLLYQLKHNFLPHF